MTDTTNENAAAAANPEPTTTLTATEAAVEGAQEPFKSEYEDNKDSSTTEPVQEDVVNPNHKEDDSPESNVGDEVNEDDDPAEPVSTDG